MLTSLKAEWRKLTTTRSTFIIIAGLLALMTLFAFYAQGLRADSVSYSNPHFISNAILNGTSIAAALTAVIGLLLFTHEYRYNTIIYTLTASRSRARSLLAKIIICSAVAVVLTVFFGLLIPLLIYFGSSLAGHHIGPQTLYFKDIIWRNLFPAWAFMMYGLLIVAFIRHQIGAVVTYFLIPSTIEGLLSLLLKDKSIYLPFSAAAAVQNDMEHLSPGKAALVVGIYLVVGWAIAFYLFIRRDAN